VKRLLMVVVGVVMSGALLAQSAEAGDRRGRDRDRRRVQTRVEYQRDGYFRDRDVVVIREYYRPYYRELPRGVRKHYARRGHLPPGWAKRIRPVPVYVERQLPVVARGYRRGGIDGHLGVPNVTGVKQDVAQGV
jgi:Ni/Co efflux regulator RcnB